MNHWISLYLSGQYPGFYRLPNRFEILLKIRQVDSTNFEDSMVLLLKDKSDVEFYNSLLSAFESIHGATEFQKLLEVLKVPQEVRINPNEKNTIQNSLERVDLEKFSSYLDGLNETDFSSFVVMPILQAMGYGYVEYKGRVNETDFGTDFYVVGFQSPGKIQHWAGVQVKSKKMTDGDTSNPGSELNKLISEVRTAFNQPHRISTGEEVLISEMLVLNSCEVPPSARDKFFKDRELKDKKIKYWAKEGILSLIAELRFEKIFTHFENNQS